MLLLFVSIIHVYFSKMITIKHTNASQKLPMLYQTKRAMLSVNHWEVAQLTYKRLNRTIFKRYTLLALPLTFIDLFLVISHRNGTLLIVEALLYVVTLIVIYIAIEHRLKGLS